MMNGLETPSLGTWPFGDLEAAAMQLKRAHIPKTALLRMLSACSCARLCPNHTLKPSSSLPDQVADCWAVLEESMYSAGGT